MLPLEHPDGIHIAFDDHRLVANAGLLLPASLALRLGLAELVDQHVDLGDAPGRANTGDKLMTLVASALAGGDCIDDTDALRSGSTGRVLGCVVKAPSTLGTFLRSFRWGHVRQLDRVSRELLARAWAAGGGPGEGPLTIDLDSTICETYGLAKEGARRHGYTGQRGYHPLLAVAAGTGDVLMARLREGRANTARGAAHFLRETLGRVRYAGATGQLTVRADSGFRLLLGYEQGDVNIHAIRSASCRTVKMRNKDLLCTTFYSNTHCHIVSPDATDDNRLTIEMTRSETLSPRHSARALIPRSIQNGGQTVLNKAHTLSRSYIPTACSATSRAGCCPPGRPCKSLRSLSRKKLSKRSALMPLTDR